jgi:pyruvate dehydrogenase E2 component (dihydrolipoamide acetyltransferase)
MTDVGVTVAMPKLGSAMKTGKVSTWCKTEGSTVTQGEDLLVIETEKISSKLEAPESGLLFRIVAPEGADVPVGAVLAIIAKSGEQPDRQEESASASEELSPARPTAPVEGLPGTGAKR